MSDSAVDIHHSCVGGKVGGKRHKPSRELKRAGGNRKGVLGALVCCKTAVGEGGALFERGKGHLGGKDSMLKRGSDGGNDK